MRRSARAAAALAAALVATANVSLLHGQVPLPEPLQESIRWRLDRGDLVGLVVATVDSGGSRFHAFGTRSLSDATPPDETTVFEIGSITKVFTATLLADMAATGEVALDDPIQTYLPAGVTAPIRDGEAITLADLATHMSGLPRLPNNMPMGDLSDPYADYTNDLMYAFLSGHELRRRAGETYEYSNFAAGLLGELLAERAGTTYEALVVERVAEPLGMPDTRITMDADMRARQAPGHNAGAGVANWEFGSLAGAGALRSTARDLIRFVQANLGLLNAAPTLEAAIATTHEARSFIGPGSSVGLGWHIRLGADGPVIWHNGGTGGYHSFIGFDTKTGRGVIVLANSSADIDDIGFHLLDPSFPLQQPPLSVSPEILETFVGRYQLAPDFVIEVSRAGQRMFVQATNQPKFEIFASSETEFFLRTVEARITFNRDASGAVASLTLHQNGRDIPGERIE